MYPDNSGKLVKKQVFNAQQLIFIIYLVDNFFSSSLKAKKNKADIKLQYKHNISKAYSDKVINNFHKIKKYSTTKLKKVQHCKIYITQRSLNLLQWKLKKKGSDIYIGILKYVDYS